MVKISRLHYVTQDLEEISHPELAECACGAGINWVQFRLKGRSYSEWILVAKKVQSVCKKYQATFIVNDNVVIARDIGADGVHLGKNDMDPREAREMLEGTPRSKRNVRGEGISRGVIIGGTANTKEDVEWLIEREVDYIGLGPFRRTETKEALSPVLGANGVKKVVEFSRQAAPEIPIVVIGGIEEGDISALNELGVHGVAVASGIGRASDRAAAAARFVKAVL